MWMARGWGVDGTRGCVVGEGLRRGRRDCTRPVLICSIF